VPKGFGRASGVLAAISIFWAVAWPLLVSAEFLLRDDMRADGFTSDINVLQLLNGAIPFGDRFLALACYAIPTGFAVWGLLGLAWLFRSFAGGAIFSGAALRAVNRITAALWLNVTTSFVAQLPISYFLTRDYPGHHGALSLGVADFVLLFLAAGTYIMGRIMREAKRTADENASFV
jgi:hypothetical protein